MSTADAVARSGLTDDCSMNTLSLATPLFADIIVVVVASPDKGVESEGIEANKVGSHLVSAVCNSRQPTSKIWEIFVAEGWEGGVILVVKDGREGDFCG